MKRSIPSLLLALLLALVCAAPALAVGKETSPGEGLLISPRPEAELSTLLFPPVRSYTGQFTDVGEEAWYAPYVGAAYSLGLIRGKTTEDRFAPEDSITVAEAVTIAARLRSLYALGDSEAGPAAQEAEGSWYAPYVAYLQSLSLLESELEGLYDSPATRAQTAHLLAIALPRELFSPINDRTITVCYAKGTHIRDVTAYTPYQQDILTLYRWGILNGVDATGTFLPEEVISRSQVAAMTARLADSSLRLHLTWNTTLTNSKAGITLPQLVTSDGTFHTAPAPEDEKAIDDDLRYMLSRGERTIALQYGPGVLNEDMASRLMGAFLDGIRGYAEQEYNAVQCTYSPTAGSFTLTFSSSLFDPRLLDSCRAATAERAAMIHDRLWEEGIITETMSQTEKARVYFTWLCENCTYHYEATADDHSHSGYGALVEQLAVCDGYTAAYNLLLKLEEIPCSTASTADHIWTTAVLDGTPVHIDPTWGDQSGEIDYRYFAMTEEFSLSRFS